MVRSLLVRRWTQAGTAVTWTSMVDTCIQLPSTCCTLSDSDRDLGESLETPENHLAHSSQSHTHTYWFTHTHTCIIQCPLSMWSWVSWLNFFLHLILQRTGDGSSTGWMPFLSLNQQCQRKLTALTSTTKKSLTALILSKCLHDCLPALVPKQKI